MESPTFSGKKNPPIPARLSSCLLENQSTSTWASISKSFSRLSDAHLLYFAAEALYVFPVWLAWLMLGPGRLYGMVYSAFGALVILTAIGVAWNFLRLRERRYEAAGIAATLTLTLTHVTYVGLPTIHWWDVVCLTEGAAFLWAGLILTFVSPYTELSWVNFTLGTYWLAIALFNFGFLLHWPKWLEVNLWVPQSLEILAFGIILLLLRRKKLPLDSRTSPASSRI
jgi:hypothetical protein